MQRSGWKQAAIEYGDDTIEAQVPLWCDILEMSHQPALKNPRDQIDHSLLHPIGGPSLEKIISSVNRSPDLVTVAIAVSDNTRPVPYSSEREDGILLPLLSKLQESGIKDRNIMIIVGTGTHQPTSEGWKEAAFGKPISDRYRIVDHDCVSPDLRSLGNIDGVEVKINRHFSDADIRIITGLVEPHFMAGFSGGRKAVCPGCVNLESTYRFHSAAYIDHPRATNLILEGNPCHEFALKVAKKFGVHFSINAILNNRMELSGVFCGDLEESHLSACERVRNYASVIVEREYDIVLTHGGMVAINHYQAAKAACCTIPVVKRGGTVVLVARNNDIEPVGKEEYKRVLTILKENGPGRFTGLIKEKEWGFVPDQWEVQKWDQFFKKLGSFDRLIYCTAGISSDELGKLPGKSGYDLAEGGVIAIADMVQSAIDYSVVRVNKITERPSMALLPDGPYGIPVIKA